MKLVNGQDYPAEHVIFRHPAIADAMPVNDVLWRAGHTQYLNHCHYMDAGGGLSAITLYGVLFAYDPAAQDITPIEALRSAFGGHITPEQLRAAHRDVARQTALFTDALWKISGGNTGRALTLLKEAEARDAECSAQLRREIRAVLDLNQQRMSMTRDSMGRPVIVRTIESSAATAYRKAYGILSSHSSLVRTLIPVYEAAYQSLLRRGGNQVAERPPQQEALPRPPLPSGNLAAPTRTPPEPAIPAPRTIPAEIPAVPTPDARPRIVPVRFEPSPQATKLRESVREDDALLQRIQRSCLLVADYNNCR